MKTYLSDEQIKLRAMEPEDLEEFYQMENSPEQWEVSNTCVPYSMYVLKQYIENSTNDAYIDRQVRLMIVRLSDNAVVGAVDATDLDARHGRGEIGIMVKAACRGNGYASRAINLMCDYLFSFLHLKQLTAHVSVNNVASLRLFEGCGFVRCGLLKEWWRTTAGYEDVVIMQRINQKY